MAPLEGAERKKMMRIKLVSNDDVNFDVDEDVACKSRLIRDMLQNLNITDPDDKVLDEPIGLTPIDGKTLKKVLEYCTAKRNEVYKPINEDEDPTIKLSEWDNEYMNISSADLVELLMAANYLDIPGIIDIITQKIANMTLGKSVEELRELFVLENDLTAEEEEEIRQRFKWIEEPDEVVPDEEEEEEQDDEEMDDEEYEQEEYEQEEYEQEGQEENEEERVEEQGEEEVQD